MSSCSCIYQAYDGPQATLHHVTTPLAKKPHECCECGRQIAPGEQYERVVGVWEGEFRTYKTCPDCLSIRNEMFCDGWSYGMVWEDLWEHLRETDGRLSDECMLNFTKAARDKVCELIQEMWDDED